MEGEEGVSTNPEQLTPVWTRQDADQFIKTEELVGKIEDASRRYPREEHTPEQIESYYQQFPSHHNIFRRAMATWRIGEYRLISAYLPFVPLMNYIEATAKLYERDSRLGQKLEFSVELIGEHLEDFRAMVQQNRYKQHSNYLADNGLRALSLYFEHGTNPQLKALALQGLRENIDYIVKRNEPDAGGYLHAGEYFLYALQLYKEGNLEERSQTKGAILKALFSTAGLSCIESFNNRAWQYSPLLHKLEPSFLEIIHDEIEKYEMDAGKIMRSWLMHEDLLLEQRKFVSIRRERSIINTLKNLQILEKARPGSAKVLQEMFGINHFGRYPVELLLRQYDERFDIGKPYGIILATADDYSEASINHAKAFSMLLNQAGEVFSIRVLECETKYGPRGIARRLLEFAKRYNPEGRGCKIGFIIIAGHGSSEGDKVFLGREDEIFRALRAADFDNANVSKITDYFVEEPDIVFVSCNGGKQIAQAASRALDARAYAYTAAINRLDRLDCRIEGDRLRLNPTFLASEEGEAVTFIRGVKQELPVA